MKRKLSLIQLKQMHPERLATGAGIILVALILARGSLAAPKHDPRILAVVTVAEGYNMDRSLCDYRKRVEELRLHADGRVVESASIRKVVCGAGGSRLESEPPTVVRNFRVSGSRLQQLAARLRSRLQDSARRLAQEPVRAAGELSHFRLARSFSLAVAEDDAGKFSPLALPEVLDTSSQSAHLGRQIRSEIRALARN